MEGKRKFKKLQNLPELSAKVMASDVQKRTQGSVKITPCLRGVNALADAQV
jgi:hypothetical protein